jgi:DNA-binding PadR family transcriptional regulator
MMSATELEAQRPPPTLLGYALLTLVVGIGWPTHAYEIVKAVRERGGALGSSESTIYRELKKLAADGYLEEVAGEVKSTKRPVVVYRQTLLGVTALSEWVETPVRTPEVDISELIPRMRAARLVPAKAVLRSLRPLSVFLEDDLDALRILERQAKKSGDWDTLMELEFELRRQLLRTYSDWNDHAVARLERLAEDQAPWSETASQEEVNDWLKQNRNLLS